jgi:hypothetical protein
MAKRRSSPKGDLDRATSMGVVFETTGPGLAATADLGFQVYPFIEDRDAVPA